MATLELTAAELQMLWTVVSKVLNADLPEYISSPAEYKTLATIEEKLIESVK